jgi:hypothetical protein
MALLPQSAKTTSAGAFASCDLRTAAATPNGKEPPDAKFNAGESNEPENIGCAMAGWLSDFAALDKAWLPGNAAASRTTRNTPECKRTTR